MDSRLWWETRAGGDCKGHVKTFRDNVHIYYTGCGDSLPGFTQVKTYQMAHFKYMKFYVC